MKLLEKPKTKSEKQLKAIYLANIIKIENKIFKSNKYNTLLNMMKMIEECIDLKLEAPKPCNNKDPWFIEICDYKLEMEKEIEKLKENPIEEGNKIKEELKEKLEKIDQEFNKIYIIKSKTIFERIDEIDRDKMIDFIFFILMNYKPRGLSEEFNFKSKEDLKSCYNSNSKKLMKELRKKYNPQRYKGDKEEQRKEYCIMENISSKLNFIENNKQYIQ